MLPQIWLSGCRMSLLPHGMHVSSPWTGKLRKGRSNSDKLFGKLLNLYHFFAFLRPRRSPGSQTAPQETKHRKYSSSITPRSIKKHGLTVSPFLRTSKDRTAGEQQEQTFLDRFRRFFSSRKSISDRKPTRVEQDDKTLHITPQEINFSLLLLILCSFSCCLFTSLLV